MDCCSHWSEILTELNFSTFQKQVLFSHIQWIRTKYRIPFIHFIQQYRYSQATTLRSVIHFVETYSNYLRYLLSIKKKKKIPLNLSSVISNFDGTSRDRRLNFTNTRTRNLYFRNASILRTFQTQYRYITRFHCWNWTKCRDRENKQWDMINCCFSVMFFWSLTNRTTVSHCKGSGSVPDVSLRDFAINAAFPHFVD